MDVRSILLVIAPTASKSDVQNALTLAAEANDHLAVLVSAIADPPTIGDYPAGEVWLDKRDQDLARIESEVLRCKEQCALAGLSFEVDSIYPERAWADAAIAARALCFDLVLVGSSALRDPELKRSLLSGVLFDAGQPAMLLPDRPATLRPKKVLLAWDGGIRAGRAVRAAYDSLVAADEVHVVLVDQPHARFESGDEPGAAMANYLARHEVNVVVDRVASCGRPIADVLVRGAMEIGADLIVMGGYGHSRLRERIFGGVTRAMIDQLKLPVLMAH
ncbi:universal stress protein [Rhizobium mongolense]|uniref:Nucleotide-binding universal stress UspA family protein n=1 Tax=Rhizobium mongolense TaxID=57676 RepID=A0A7W6RTC8_9HYPH|nr:universal stress protein [Rhizobium mongolense]MBB4277548.1 nucleotide-binding universal stress UspA family protein [Rhizobium mongolense]